MIRYEFYDKKRYCIDKTLFLNKNDIFFCWGCFRCDFKLPISHFRRPHPHLGDICRVSENLL